jgi:hypothetical protein
MEIITCHSTLREGLTVGMKLRWVSSTTKKVTIRVDETVGNRTGSAGSHSQSVGRKLRWVSFTIEGNDGDVYIRLADTTKLRNKKGLIVYGIEIRPIR